MEVIKIISERIQGFQPTIAIPPGETIKEYLESMGMNRSQLAKRLACTPKILSEIIIGKVPITAQTAQALESVFKTPASFWLALENNYQRIKVRLERRNINETGLPDTERAAERLP